MITLCQITSDHQCGCSLASSLQLLCNCALCNRVRTTVMQFTVQLCVQSGGIGSLSTVSTFAAEVCFTRACAACAGTVIICLNSQMRRCLQNIVRHTEFTKSARYTSSVLMQVAYGCSQQCIAAMHSVDTWHAHQGHASTAVHMALSVHGLKT